MAAQTQEQDRPVRVVLGGFLGRKFAREYLFHLDNPCPAEAFRAIDVNTKGEFTRYLRAQGESRFYKVALGRKDNLLDKGELTQRTGHGDIYILPVVKGRESGGAKILAAVALAVVTYGASLYMQGAAFAASTIATVTTVGYSMAASLALGGIVQLLTPVPSFNQSAEDSARSHVFQGNATTINQGSAVSLLYGRMLAVPKPISIAFTAVDQAKVNSFAEQEYDIEYGEGGIVDYRPRDKTPEDNLPAA